MSVSLKAPPLLTPVDQLSKPAFWSVCRLLNTGEQYCFSHRLTESQLGHCFPAVCLWQNFVSSAFSGDQSLRLLRAS